MSNPMKMLIDSCPLCGGEAAPVMESAIPNSVTKEEVFTHTVFRCYNCGYEYDCTVVQERSAMPVIPLDNKTRWVYCQKMHEDRPVTACQTCEKAPYCEEME